MSAIFWSLWSACGYVLLLGTFMLINALGVALTALQLPGAWLMVGFTSLVAWWGWDQQLISGYTLAALLGLALVGELVEFVAGAMGARWAGASKRGAAIAIVAAVVGAVVGTFAIPIPIVGTLLGAALGAGAGSILGDKWAGRNWQAAFKGGQGAAIGKLGGSVAKLIVAMVMWLVAVGAILWP